MASNVDSAQPPGPSSIRQEEAVTEFRQEPSGALKRFTALRIEHLYFILAVAAFGLLVSIRPTEPHDLWFHLRAGQLHSELGRVLRVDTFSWSISPNTPYLYGSWLGEWLYYHIYAMGGIYLVIFTRNVLAMVAITLIGLEARWRSGSWRLAGLAVTLTCLISLNNTSVRPQNLSWVPFALYFVVLSRYAVDRLRPLWLLFLPAMMVFWTNTHGAFVLGIILIGLFAIGETFRRLLHHSGALPWSRIGALYAVGAVTVLTTAINPRGFGIFAYHLSALTNTAVHVFIEEWQPPTPSGLANVTFFASVIMLLAAFAFARRKPTLTDVLVISVFLWWAWDAVRGLTWYSMVAMPVLAQCLGARYSRSRPAYRGRQRHRLNWAIAVLVTLTLFAVQPWTVRGVPLPDAYQERMLPPPAAPLLTTGTPVFAAEYLRAHPGGRLFNEMGYGSYLIWTVPEQPVFIDPRIELYSLKQWQDYGDISEGNRSLELLRRYGANRVLLSREQQPKLSEVLATAPNWKREYADTWSEVWTFTSRD